MNTHETPKILVAINAFKEHMSSWEVGRAVAAGLQKSLVKAECMVLPVSDGGDGFLDCLQFLYPESEEVWCNVHGPDGTMLKTRYVTFTKDGRKHAGIEFAEATGVRRVRGAKDALKASSYGVGEVILHAVMHGSTCIFLGLGGSATTDGGLGLLQAIGVEFFDEDGERITGSRSADTVRVHRMEAGHVRTEMAGCEIEIVCFCDGISSIGGEDGSWNRAAGKGATAKEIEVLHDGIDHMIAVLNAELQRDISLVAMTGCAGGAAGGLYAALGAELVYGADTLLNMAGFDDLVCEHDVVVTGEGVMDATTCTGKLPAVIAGRAFDQQVPCIGVAAEISCAVEQLVKAGFSSVYRVELAHQSFLEIVQQKLGKPLAEQAGILIGNMLALLGRKALF